MASPARVIRIRRTTTSVMRRAQEQLQSCTDRRKRYRLKNLAEGRCPRCGQVNDGTSMYCAQHHARQLVFQKESRLRADGD
jgi:uncharacterized OB-fold protein